jgi:CheY-like chemotaxis protein
MSKILVVDDQYMNRDLLVRRLGSKGFEAVEANSGQSALDILYKEEVDLILLDIHMPNMDGNEVLQKVRDIHSALELPIIMVTANVNSLSRTSFLLAI